ncbi:MAG: hypothetical protein LBG80_11940 [Bacteroidales bacterium]|nr:hypothetical protein [Bacteroidales bacterium]
MPRIVVLLATYQNPYSNSHKSLKYKKLTQYLDRPMGKKQIISPSLKVEAYGYSGWR